MKQLLMRALLCGIFFCTGCSGRYNKENIAVLLPEGGELPKSIAGQWKAEGSLWAVQFDQYGYPKTATHPMNGALIKPGETTTHPFSKVDGIEIYACDQWKVTYLTGIRELTLEIPILYATQDVPAIIEGTIVEVLSGTFNEDFTVWNVTWQSTSEFDVTEPTSGKTVRTQSLENEKDKGSLVFHKVMD